MHVLYFPLDVYFMLRQQKKTTLACDGPLLVWNCCIFSSGDWRENKMLRVVKGKGRLLSLVSFGAKKKKNIEKDLLVSLDRPIRVYESLTKVNGNV